MYYQILLLTKPAFFAFTAAAYGFVSLLLLLLCDLKQMLAHLRAVSITLLKLHDQVLLLLLQLLHLLLVSF